MKNWLCILLSLFVYMNVWANTDSLSIAERNAAQGFNDTIDRLAEDFVEVSLVVCDPDEVLYSTLGHAALHLQCPVFNLDYIFSYESESVRDKIWTFLKGDLKMGMFAMTPEEFLEPYRESGRGVREYTINLSPVQKQELWRVMDEKVAEGPNLPYDYYQRGCAKSVVRVVREALGNNAIHYAPWSDKYKNHTLRELGCAFVEGAPWEEFYSYFLLGTIVDKKVSCEQKLIIPTDLVEVWQQARFDNGKPVLDSEARILVDATKHNKGTWCTPLLVTILLLLLAFVPWRPIDYCLLVLYTMIGAVITYLIVFSGLPCTDWNWLIIPFNILPAIFWHWRRYWALPYAGIIGVWCIAMVGAPHRLVEAAHILLALSFAVILIKQYLSVRKASLFAMQK